MDSLREQVMINQFAFVSGCRPEQAKQYLMSCNWHFEMALSMFFQEATVAPCPSCNGTQTCCQYPMCGAPTNTPVTPSSFPDTLSAFSKLLTSEKLAPHTLAYPTTSLISQAETKPQLINTRFTTKQ